MNSFSIQEWKLKNQIHPDLSFKIRQQDTLTKPQSSPVPGLNISAGIPSRGLETIEQNISVAENNIKVLEDLLKQVQGKNQNSKQKQEENQLLMEKFSQLTSESNELLKLKNNFESLRVEVDSVISITISQQEFDQAIEFLESLKKFSDFQKHFNQLSNIVQKTIKGKHLFESRSNYKEQDSQVYLYRSIESRLKNVMVNLFVEYYEEYFESNRKFLLQKGLAQKIAEDTFLFNTKLEDCPFQNLFILLTILIAPEFMLSHIQKGVLSNIFEGEHSEVKQIFKKQLMGLTLNMEYYSGFANKISNFLLLLFQNKEFRETKLQIENYYMTNYFKMVLEFEKLFEFEKNPVAKIQISSVMIIWMAFNLNTIFGEGIFEEEVFLQCHKTFCEKNQKNTLQMVQSERNFEQFSSYFD